ncbi:MAG: hypothetical protein NTZ01_07325, partial [Verrucomicrobia bacterium]|nr:hypothetical protein [Verrucomicrobiota bacterium]
MKISPWLIGGAVALLIVGLAGLTMGIFLTGSLAPAEAPGGGGKSATEELKQKSESTKIKLGQLSDKQRPGLGGLKDHRVFVSRSIVFLPQEAEHVQPLDPEQITEDGIKVGWKLKYGFSPEDREVASQDEDQDGFTN